MIDYRILLRPDGSCTIPQGTKEISRDAFSWALQKLKRINLPPSVTKIAANAFVGCSELTSISFPETLTEIDGCAFSGCTGLTSIHIPASVTKIEDYAFCDCGNISEISVAEGNPMYKSENNCLLTKDGKRLLLGCRNSIIPETVTEIGIAAFFLMKGFSHIDIPSNVTIIDKGAFYGCDLETITFPDGLLEIRDEAFQCCWHLKKFSLPSSLKEIGKEAFMMCEKLRCIDIPANVIKIGRGAFCYCTKLKAITVSSSNPSFYAVNNCLLAKKGKRLIAGCKASIIPEGVLQICANAFDGCKELQEISIPSSVKRIGKLAFSSCEKIREIVIPEGVTIINEATFDGCYNLETVSIPKSVIKIGNYAFENCYELKNIEIPERIQEVGEGAFIRCFNLKNAKMPISGKVKIGTNAFEKTQVAIPQTNWILQLFSSATLPS